MPTKKLTLWCYVDNEEHALISASAEQAGLSRSTYIKRICLRQPTPSLEKQKLRRELFKLNADLGRLGGLFKLCLSEKDGPFVALHQEVRRILREIETRQQEVKAAVSRV